MGCAVGTRSSASKQVAIPLLRRRLTLGELGPHDKVTDEERADVSEDDRSLVMFLTHSQTLDFIKDEERKYSVSSETDQQGHRVGSFSSKSVKLRGEVFDAPREGIGFACKKGLKPEAPNQDSFFIMKVEGRYSLYGVFDGHGRKGHDVSNFVKDSLPKILLSQENLNEDPLTALTRTFEKTQYYVEKATNMKKIDALRSGTTCSVVLHKHDERMLYIAHVGDSRVVLGKIDTSDGGMADQKGLEALDLTVDHKPNLPAEKARIEKAGGMVIFDGGWNYRVYAKGKKDAKGKRYPGLNMSRAMGDLSGFYDAGISAVPDVHQRLVDSSVAHGEPTTAWDTKSSKGEGDGAENRVCSRAPSVCSSECSRPTVSSYTIDPNSDKFILLCSDGVWEFVSSEEAVMAVCGHSGDAMAAAEHLAALAWERWMQEMDGEVVDDITAIVVHLAS
mmetsp:Transcript_89641/g.254121  ORF Transcript_89641/g.254121 Transcript_89641/m.254121 type:complete len:447 (-) Transcript_89641:119-1459(-)